MIFMEHLNISCCHNNEIGRLDMCGCAHWSDVGLGGSDTSLLGTKCDLRMSLGLQSVIEWSRNKPVQKEKIRATFFCKNEFMFLFAQSTVTKYFKKIGE